MLDERKKSVFQTIVEEYTKTAKPVGSNFLVDKYQFDVSSATCRNDMNELEKEGLITQPHPSAGRIPTEKGYHLYIESFLSPQPLSPSEITVIRKTWDSETDSRLRLKELGKKVSELSNGAVLIAFSRNDFFYTGLSNLFRQPEFSQSTILVHLGDVIDHLDEVSIDLLSSLSDSIEILLGKDNPVSHECGLVVSRISIDHDKGLFGIFGPMRMDYGQAKSLVLFSKLLMTSS